MPEIGHNRGPSLAGGASWLRHCWAAVRGRLVPRIEVVWLRVKRAQAFGLGYRTYASVRAATGHVVAAFLLCSNALRLTDLRPAMPDVRAVKLADAKCGRLAGYLPAERYLNTH